jgi:radical SAM protein with 4Fe4S-binding SPASM domain
MVKFYDPNIPNKSKKSDEVFQLIPNTDIPLPSEVEISESGTCNRSCSFCPRSDPDFPDIKKFISNKLHNKLITELSDLKFEGTLRYSGFVEPLLDKNIFNLIENAKFKLPKSNIEMVTNGDVLNDIRLNKLFKSGLSKLLISIYDGPEDVKKFQKMMDRNNIDTSKYFLRHRYLPPEEDYGITMSNRAGLMKNAEHSIAPLVNSLKKPCYYPSYTFFLDYNGDVLMCPHDWGKKNILGNLEKQNFKEIWLSTVALLTRKGLIKADRNFSPCDVCDVSGDLIGKKHAKHWEKSFKN